MKNKKPLMKHQDLNKEEFEQLSDYLEQHAQMNIEKMDGKNFTSYMIFLMAIRNKEVKEIVSKIKYIFEYIANNDSFLDNEHIEEHDVNIIYNDGKLEYDTFSYMIEDMDFKKNLSENQEKLKQEIKEILGK